MKFRLRSHAVFYQAILVLVLSCGVIWLQAQDYPRQLRTGDSYIYLSTAKHLVDKGVLTNGTFGATHPEKGKDGQGSFFTPLYPAFLSIFMRGDKNFYEDSACHIASKNGSEAEKCSNRYESVISAQILLSALTCLIIWLGALLLTKNLAISWLSLVIGLSSGVYGQFSTEIMTESLLFPLFAAASLLAALAWQKREDVKMSGLLWLASGLVFGLVTLTRPAYAYLIYASFVFLFLACAFLTKQNFMTALRYPILLIAGFAICIMPWILRNGLATGDYVISKGYGPFVLVQRLAYNDMSMEEWSASFIYHLPDFGDSLSEKIFGKEATERFDYGNKDGFFYVGHTALREKISTEAGSEDNIMSHALKEYLIPNLPKHFMTSVAMVFNGLWIGKYWGLVAIPLFIAAFFLAIRRNWQELIVLSFPGWFMLGFHAFTSVNVTRYNMPLVPSLSLAAAWVLFLLFCYFRKPRGT